MQHEIHACHDFTDGKTDYSHRPSPEKLGVVKTDDLSVQIKNDRSRKLCPAITALVPQSPPTGGFNHPCLSEQCVRRRSLGLTVAGICSVCLFLLWLLCHREEGNSDPIVSGGNWAVGQ